jgi:hypothetical protein
LYRNQLIELLPEFLENKSQIVEFYPSKQRIEQFSQKKTPKEINGIYEKGNFFCGQQMEL